jgi:hypothetical protein
MCLAKKAGEIFVDKRGIKYILAFGPRGNLRPYTYRRYIEGFGKVVKNTPNSYIKVIIIASVAAVAIGFWAWKKFHRKKFASHNHLAQTEKQEQD